MSATTLDKKQSGFQLVTEGFRSEERERDEISRAQGFGVYRDRNRRILQTEKMLSWQPAHFHSSLFGRRGIGERPSKPALDSSRSFASFTSRIALDYQRNSATDWSSY